MTQYKDIPKNSYKTIPNVLTIAGSDSGGGAGIQADIKAISATGSYACSVITALTAQNTQRVSQIMSVDPLFVADQLDAVFSDIKISAVKIGMLNDSKIIEVVASKLIEYKASNIVLDPVMVATSGDPLIASGAIESLKSLLLPIADLITPNLPEAQILVNDKSDSKDLNLKDFNLKEIIESLKKLDTKNTLLKGGHFDSENCDDLLINQNSIIKFSTKRLKTKNTHGTGCSLSSAIASYLAMGLPIEIAIEKAKDFLTQALRHAHLLDVGKGSGPIDSFYKLRLKL